MKLVIKILGVAFLIIIVLGTFFYAALPLRGHIPVLMYHFVDTEERAEKEKNVVSLENFKQQMELLERFGFRVISMEDYEKTLKGLRKPSRREVVITFDDGNYTYYDKAFPILKEYNYPSTNFVVVENIKKQIHGSMTYLQIQELLSTGLLTIGSHTRTHPILTEIDEVKQHLEISGSKAELETMFNVPVRYFAYPAGILNDEVLEKTKEAGYELAFTTSLQKRVSIDSKLFAITRVKISRTSDHPFAFWIKLSGIYDAFKGFLLKLRAP